MLLTHDLGEAQILIGEVDDFQIILVAGRLGGGLMIHHVESQDDSSQYPREKKR